MARLPEGSWILGSNYESVLDAEASSGMDEVVDPTHVRVSRGCTDVRLVLRARPQIRGRVVREDGHPITLFEISHQQLRHPEGRFSVQAWGSGEQTLYFRAPGFSTRSLQVQLREGKDLELGDVVLKDLPGVSGRVLEAGTSAPIAGARVEVGGRVAPTQRDGSFTVEGVPERALLTVTHPDYASVQVPIREDSREVSVVLEPGARLEGRISLEGVPVQSGSVYLRSEQGGVVATTGFWEGHYALSALASGRFVVQVVAPSDEGPAPMFPLRQVELTPGGKVTLDFTAQVAGAALEVFVPERNLEVHLFPGSLPLMGPKQGLYTKIVGSYIGKPVREGVVRFSRVPAGHYTLFAMRRDEDVTSVHREELEIPSEGELSFSLLPQWTQYAD
ncbi:carboxypeptidase-like regulatory domain-containing protein [Vitiosangium sp. GDMCC 1.1324]|uniref:carboxypeptidase-like regulatory domain-containing protein n=1 Tax=Vitiosangium sp. (strain GDMCC 1.1324) TaxID=2138576 RepID=UPI0011B85A68|nr:carboxypeptidase-like regulatory domain-containing protein [Vitiosangium sp. GDMCC 1.1324]